MKQSFVETPAAEKNDKKRHLQPNDHIKLSVGLSLRIQLNAFDEDACFAHDLQRKLCTSKMPHSVSRGSVQNIGATVEQALRRKSFLTSLKPFLIAAFCSRLFFAY